MFTLKFGGTSVGSPASLQALAEVVQSTHAQNQCGPVVVSAFSGVTNQLIELARLAEAGNPEWEVKLEAIRHRHLSMVEELFPAQSRSAYLAAILKHINDLEDLVHGISLLGECSDRSLDLVMSFGERLSAFVVAEWLVLKGLPAYTADARAFIQTDRRFGAARVQMVETFAKIQAYFQEKNGIAVVTGFIAQSEKGETTTLGRGGSDYTAAILGAALNAEEIHIYTDVNGMMTADPRLVPQAFTIPEISYAEAMELSHFGAKVIYPPTLQPAFAQKIPIRILNTFDPQHPGTRISEKPAPGRFAVTGLSAIREIALWNVEGSGLVGVAGFASRLFSALGREHINVILITQASSEHSISFAVNLADREKTKQAILREFEHELQTGKLDAPECEESVSIVAVVGDNMRQTPGISAKVFGALGRNGVNIRATAQGSSELNISIVIPNRDVAKALQALHQTFFLSDRRQLHVYLAGPGLIGKALLRQMAEQKAYLEQNLNLELVLEGLISRKKMAFQPDPTNWESSLEAGAGANPAEFVAELLDRNRPNSVFVDCTPGETYIAYYGPLLEKSVAVVTPNKLANSGPFARYRDLRENARKGNTRFLYETNVGAGLPVIQTLRNLILSGDRILRIEAMVSGTLSFIFNTFKAGLSFHDVVAEAKALGYTEPDPRDDLSGKDMARKLVILARETGLETEPEDVQVENILPRACLEAADTALFMESLKTENAYFAQLATEAESQGKKLKFICRLEGETVSIQLQRIGPDHPFWNSSGADNILAFYTQRYSQRPLVVQGPGAGAEVTAAGVFGDLISLGN